MIQRTPILSLLDHPTTDGFNNQLAQDTDIVKVERDEDTHTLVSRELLVFVIIPPQVI